ncbi:hypothetical protein [Planococcus salinarum]|uniref:hypothetical protein n=1 Tax=Planococcus salinarum TaxID=622695 RepID=UPI000E3E8450|nr:hypothetical protein [Planococcus salinarum]TAA73363.1 hypothetical protein D2909_00510 [Planococcus salinarum]
MVVSGQTSNVSIYSRLVKASLIGSTVAGVLFGIYMQVTGMIPVLASLVGSESLLVGWTIHMMISWTFGLGYGAMTLLSSRYYLLGVVHGVLIWVIGPLLVMPLMMRMGPMFGQMFAGAQLMSLVTHLAFSLILAAVFSRLVRD